MDEVSVRNIRAAQGAGNLQKHLLHLPGDPVFTLMKQSARSGALLLCLFAEHPSDDGTQKSDKRNGDVIMYAEQVRHHFIPQFIRAASVRLMRSFGNGTALSERLTDEAFHLPERHSKNVGGAAILFSYSRERQSCRRKTGFLRPTENSEHKRSPVRALKNAAPIITDGRPCAAVFICLFLPS